MSVKTIASPQAEAAFIIPEAKRSPALRTLQTTDYQLPSTNFYHSVRSLL